MGAGAIGCNVGGPLAEAGHDVLLIDQWAPNVEAINASGLRLRDEAGIAAIAGAHRTLGCVITISGALVGPGDAIRTDAVSGTHGVKYTIGEIDGVVTERARELAQIMNVVGPSETTTNLNGQRWSKLTVNCMLNGLAGLTGLESGNILVDDNTRPLAIQLAAEAIAVGQGAGHQIEPIITIEPTRYVDAAAGGRELASLDTALKEIGAVVAKTGGRPSALQDVMKGRRTEIDYLNGVVVKLGGELGIPAPMNEAVVEEFERLGVDFTPAAANVAPLVGIMARREEQPV
jgi:2-dehydropantoate 2-reductase